MENTLKFTFLASLNTNSGWHLYLENFLSNIKSFLATEKKKRKCTHLYPSTFREAENKLKKKISYVFEEKNVYQGVEIYAAAYTSTKTLS